MFQQQSHAILHTLLYWCSSITASGDDPDIHTCGHRCSFSAHSFPVNQFQLTNHLVLLKRECWRRIAYLACFSSCKHFRVKSDLISQRAAGHRSVLGGQDVEAAGSGGFFSKEHQCQQTSWRAGDMNLYIDDILYTSPHLKCCVIVTGQYTQGIRTNKHKSCHLLHHTYSTMRAERIDTPENPQYPQYKRGPTIHMP